MAKAKFLLKGILHLGLLACFLLQVRESVYKFLARKTITSMEEVGFDTIEMPYVTVCPGDPGLMDYYYETGVI